jgi:malic enzyme
LEWASTQGSLSNNTICLMGTDHPLIFPKANPFWIEAYSSQAHTITSIFFLMNSIWPDQKIKKKKKKKKKPFQFFYRKYVE